MLLQERCTLSRLRHEGGHAPRAAIGSLMNVRRLGSGTSVLGVAAGLAAGAVGLPAPAARDRGPGTGGRPSGPRLGPQARPPVSQSAGHTCGRCGSRGSAGRPAGCRAPRGKGPTPPKYSCSSRHEGPADLHGTTVLTDRQACPTSLDLQRPTSIHSRPERPCRPPPGGPKMMPASAMDPAALRLRRAHTTRPELGRTAGCCSGTCCWAGTCHEGPAEV